MVTTGAECPSLRGYKFMTKQSSVQPNNSQLLFRALRGTMADILVPLLLIGVNVLFCWCRLATVKQKKNSANIYARVCQFDKYFHVSNEILAWHLLVWKWYRINFKLYKYIRLFTFWLSILDISARNRLWVSVQYVCMSVLYVGLVCVTYCWA